MPFRKLSSFLHRIPLMALAGLCSIMSGSAALAETAAPKSTEPLDVVLAYWPQLVGGAALIVVVTWAVILWYLYFKPLTRTSFERLAASTRCFVANLTARQVGILTDAGINITTGSQQGQDGIFFDKDQMDRVVSALNATPVAALPTTVDALSFVILRIQEPAYEPENYDNYGDKAILQRVAGLFDFNRRRYENFVFDSVEPILSAILVEGLKKRHVWLLHKDDGYVLERHKPAHGQNFSVFLPGLASDTPARAAPATVFGFKPNEKTQFFAHTNKAIALQDPATGQVLGEVTASTLTLHYNAFVDRSEQELAVFARLLQQAVQELNPSRFVENVLKSLPLPAESLRQLALSRTDGCAVFEENLPIRQAYIAKTILRTIMVPALGRDIYLKECQGGTQAPLRDGMFHIFLHSAMRSGDTVETSTRMFGINRARGARSYLPTGLGLPLVSDEGEIYGELVDDNLYIFLSDALGNGTRADAEFFARLAMHARAVILEEIQCQDPTQNTLVQVQKLASYGTDVLLKERTGKALSQLQERAANMSKAQETFGSTLRLLVAEQKDLTRLNGYPEQALGAEFDAILAIKKVLDVEVTKSRIIVKTDTLYCVDPRTGKKHEIGQFEIFIRTSYDNDEQVVRWMNRTRTVTTPAQSTMHAPHVSSNGAACMGNTKGTFPMLVEKREFASVVELAIAFVESVNVSDTWGQHIKCWPLADE
ncbi:MAG: hypothetical protein IPL73_17125 [Candidatus Obscuribacter sp.]|nr:hypothetical protein [Candidatus Obscuribacter sp.]